MNLYQKRCGFREISRITGLSRVTVSRWVPSGTFPEMSTRPPKPGRLEPQREWLEEQRKSGNHNASQIRREMVTQRFTGSKTIVRDEVARWRKNGAATVTAPAHLPSAFRVSRWLMPWRMANNERGKKLCFPLHRADVRKRAAVENSTATGTRLLPDPKNQRPATTEQVVHQCQRKRIC